MATQQQDFCSYIGTALSDLRTMSPSILGFRTAKRNGDKMRDLEEMAAKLLETASKLPPGPERHELLKQIATFHARIATITAKQEQLQSAK